MSTTSPDLGAPSVLLPPKTLDVDGVERAVRDLLVALGQGDKDEVMANTPRRVAELYAETINPTFIDAEVAPKTFDNPGITDPIYVNDVQYVSMCEHHLAPAFGIAHVAYIPGARIVGYSKLKKALNYVARQPTLNERLVVAVADYIDTALAPAGLAVALRSVHCCIALRTNAPMQEVVTVTAFRGCYDLEAGERAQALRAEFFATVAASRGTFLGA
jgi:GTP cyclohydrolase I